MKVKEVKYPVSGKRKFLVEHKGKTYTCYRCICSVMNSVFIDNKNIIDTKLGMEIMLHCK